MFNLLAVKAFINFMVALFFPVEDVRTTYGLIEDAVEEAIRRRRTPLGRRTSLCYHLLFIVFSWKRNDHFCWSIEWKSIRLDGPAHGIVNINGTQKSATEWLGVKG